MCIAREHCINWHFVCFQFGCQFCCKIFKSKYVMLNHLRAKHKIGEAFRCPTCGKDDFTSYDTYIRHKRKCFTWLSGIDSVLKICNILPLDMYFSRLWNISPRTVCSCALHAVKHLVNVLMYSVLHVHEYHGIRLHDSTCHVCLWRRNHSVADANVCIEHELNFGDNIVVSGYAFDLFVNKVHLQQECSGG